MSIQLREAVLRHLQSRGPAGAEGSVERLSLEVEVDGRIETVLIALRGGELRCVSSDGLDDGPHVSAALRFVAGLELGEASLRPGPPLAATTPDNVRPAHDLADALDDLLTAVTRVGVHGAQYAPSVEATLERVLEAAPSPTPAGLGRFVGRLNHALRERDPRKAARVLDGVSRLVDALRIDAPTADSSIEVETWLGAWAGTKSEVELLYDRTMVEVGREWMAGVDRASVERRYLVDVRTGEVYREDRPRNAVASLGPCPRALHIGLAEVENSLAPRRIRVLQYEVQPDVSAATWERLKQVASQSFAEVTECYRRSLRAAPALAEPFFLLKPYRTERNGVFKAFDAEGHQLVLDRTERRGAVLAFYDLLAGGMDPVWLAGRLTDTGATLCLAPFAVGTAEGRYIRL